MSKWLFGPEAHAFWMTDPAQPPTQWPVSKGRGPAADVLALSVLICKVGAEHAPEPFEVPCAGWPCLGGARWAWSPGGQAEGWRAPPNCP